MKRNIWALALAAMMLLSACDYNEPILPEETSAPVQSTPPTETTVETTPTEATTEPSTQPSISVPDALAALLEECGASADTLAALGCTQLVTVVSEGASAQIDLYLLEVDQWCKQESFSCSGFVGKQGTQEEKTEGDMTTPKGLFPVGLGFYISEAPQTGLQTFQITTDTYWVDDPTSRYYNKRIEGTENKDWKSAEHMISYGEAYAYGFVVDYNTDAIPYAGSAIFVHVGSRATAGCIATQKASVLQYLSALNESENPYILIN